MKRTTPAETVAPCGLICGICKFGQINCKLPCNSYNNNESCYQKKCCKEKGINGCWECDQFPCSNGHFAEHDSFRNINMTSCQFIKDEGIVNFVNRFTDKLGNNVSYGELSNKDLNEILAKK